MDHSSSPSSSPSRLAPKQEMRERGHSPHGSDYNLRRLFSTEFKKYTFSPHHTPTSSSASQDSFNSTSSASTSTSTSTSSSPLDKPLPPLPQPATTFYDVPIIHVPSPTNQITTVPKPRAPVCADANDVWRQRFLSARSNSNFIDAVFADTDIHFGARKTGYAWKLGKKVYERVHQFPAEPKSKSNSTSQSEKETDMAYATAVYECSQTKGRVRGPKAYMKIYMQIPYLCESCQHISTKSLELPSSIKSEIRALKRMCLVQEDVPAPRLLATKTKPQPHCLWIPEGFLNFVVMQRLPATPLSEDVFWRMSSQVRDEVRASFKTALEQLRQAGVKPRNRAIENLAFNGLTKTCYIIDLHNAQVTDQASIPPPLFHNQAPTRIPSPIPWFEDHEYFRWGLSRSMSEPCESAFYDDSEKSQTTHVGDSKLKLALSRATHRDRDGNRDTERGTLRKNRLAGIRPIMTSVGG